jgi:hypothetical protein
LSGEPVPQDLDIVEIEIDIPDSGSIVPEKWKISFDGKSGLGVLQGFALFSEILQAGSNCLQVAVLFLEGFDGMRHVPVRHGDVLQIDPAFQDSALVLHHCLESVHALIAKGGEGDTWKKVAQGHQHPVAQSFFVEGEFILSPQEQGGGDDKTTSG